MDAFDRARAQLPGRPKTAFEPAEKQQVLAKAATPPNVAPPTTLFQKTTTVTKKPRKSTYVTVPIIDREKEEEEWKSKYGILQRVASWQSAIVGAAVGLTAAAPLIAIHYLFVDHSYQSLGQWEWDTVTAALMGAAYSTVFRYSMRQDVQDSKLSFNVFAAFVVVRSLGRVTIPYECSALPLQCGEPIGYMNWSMMNDLGINMLESVALFGVVGLVMESLLKQKWIRQFPGN